MSNIVTIHETEVQPIAIRGQRVVTLAMIDQIHQRPTGTAKRNFSENRSRLTEDEDFFQVTGDEIRTQSLKGVFQPRTRKGILLTESGYLLLVKSFTDDLAWRIQKQLVQAYFRADHPPIKSLLLRRWLLWFDPDGTEHAKEIPENALVLTREQFLKAFTTPGEMMVSTEQMYEFVLAGLANLKRRLDFQRGQIDRLQAK